MNSEEFINEIKENYPENGKLLADYREFIQYQQLAKQTLDAFVAVCDSSEIWYQLAWGSLLGAIRDEGQIPWDYDIDVFVLAKDRATLVEELRAKLDEAYSFECLETNPKCRNYIMRIYPIGYDSSALHVDVFFLAGVPVKGDLKEKWLRKMKWISRARYNKFVDIKREFAGRPKRQAYLAAMKIPATFCSVKHLDRTYWDLVDEQSLDTAKEWAECDVFAPEAIFDASLLRETVTLHIGTSSYVVSKNYRELLQRMYGDYTSYPSFDKRLSEMKEHLAKLRRLCPLRD